MRAALAATTKAHALGAASILALLISLSYITEGVQAGCPFHDSNQEYQAYPMPKGSPNDQPNLILWKTPQYAASQCPANTYKDIASTFQALVADGSVGQAQLLRIGFHTCVTGTAAAFANGCMGGWLQYDVDANYPVNGGLNGVNGTIQYLLAIKAAYPCITFADLATFAGALGAELAGGPPVAWYPGRPDALAPGPNAPPLSAHIPNGMFNGAAVYAAYTKLGLTVREMVALNGGGHSLGGAATSESGWLGSFTPFDCTWPTPVNKYFVDLMKFNWTAVQAPITGQLQFVLAASQSGVNYTDTSGLPIFRLPSDMALRESHVLAKWANKYADDPEAFTRAFQRVNQRMLQLGAGSSYTLRPEWFHWKGLSGKWEGFGTDIAPEVD